MKKKPSRRVLSLVIAVCMIAALLPASALASTTVTPSPNTGNSNVNSLEVEYFSSTLYNWDESKANAATATADYNSSITSGVLSTASSGTLWTITAVEGVENGYTVSTTIDGTEWYMTWGGGNDADAELTTTATTILITDETYTDNRGTTYYVISLAVTSGSYPYLNYYSSSSGFGGWSSGSSDDVGSRFYIYASTDIDTALTTSNITSGSQYYIKNTRANAYLTGSTTTSEGYEGKGFYFTGAGNQGSSVPTFSKWNSTSQNYSVYTGLAASDLGDSSNVPFNNKTVNAAELFSASGNDYTAVYSNVNVPFYIDDDGYYVLDSDVYGVYFDGGLDGAESGATMLIADLPSVYQSCYSSGAGSDGYYVGFAPFNNLKYNSVTTTNGRNSHNVSTTGYLVEDSDDGYTYNGSTLDMVYGFGMVTSVDFQMTDDGQVDGENIVFEFSGDDDVWVYIDDVLVLDIGGTHDAIDGTINFHTGDVTLTSNYNNTTQTVIDMSGTYTANEDGSLSETNLYTALGKTLTQFASEGTHTMTIYYMDRGQSKTNCYMKFNLPQEDSLSVTKNIASRYTDNEDGSAGDIIDDDTMANLSNIDFSFTLYDDEDSVVANASYSLYDSDGSFVQNGSTDSTGTFTLKNGYTAVFNNVDLDKEGSWYVVENLSSSRWVTTSTYEATINSSTITGSGDATSGTVTLTDGQEDGEVKYIGSDLSSDSIAYVFTNQYVKGADPDVDVYDETIVLDYGLPVEVDVTANDITTLYGASISSDYDPTYSLTLNNADDNGIYTGTYGYAEVKDGKIVYTLTKDFCGIETVEYTYSVTVTVEDDSGDQTTKDGSATGTLTIIPATLMYYEENFGSTTTTTTDDGGNETTTTSTMVKYSTGNVTWEPVGKSATGYQETGLVGTTDDSTYGTDAIYLDELGDSYGTSMYANVGQLFATGEKDEDGNEVNTGAGAAFEYDFTGTGTAILSRISTNSAYIQVKITHVGEDGNTVVDDCQYIDTRVVQNVSDSGTLYNIPVYNNESLDYGNYHVYVYIYKEGTTVYPTYDDDGKVLADSTSGGDFYLDGIRVYQPMGTEDDEADGYSTAASAYATDGEANVSIINVREKIAGDYDDGDGWSEGNIFTLTDIDGNIIDIDTYTAIGPNEELYLTKNQEVSFYLVNWASQSYKIYLGLKAPNGSKATVTIGDTTLTINNSTVCYYDISDYVSVESYDVSEDEDGSEMVNVGVVTITGDSGLTALTNLKVTGVDPFELDYKTETSANSAGTVSLTSLDADTLYLLPTTISLITDDGADVDESTVFTPDSIKLVCNYSSKTKKATVTAATSTDVARVTINGEDVTYKKVSGQYNWSNSYTKVTKGTEYEVILYDADGNASEIYTVTAE